MVVKIKYEYESKKDVLKLKLRACLRRHGRVLASQIYAFSGTLIEIYFEYGDACFKVDRRMHFNPKIRNVILKNSSCLRELGRETGLMV